MSEANELLDGLTGDEVATYAVEPETKPHIIIDKDRNIIVPDALKRIAVQFDHKIETVTFDCPRYWDGHDLFTMIVFINYKRADNYMDSYRAENVTIDNTDDSVMHFTWTITRDVTLLKGNLTFLICVKKADATSGLLERHWNSELNKDMYVSEGMECLETVTEMNPDIITQMLIQLGELEAATLPSVSTDDNGKVLQVVDGAWAAADAPSGGDGSNASLPVVGSEDDGKIMQVVDGAWAAVTLADSAVKTYIEDYLNEALGGDY